MTPAQLIAAGHRLYGRKLWKVKLARDLGVDVSTVHRMGHRSQIPGPWTIAINALLASRKAQDVLEREARKLLPRRLRRKKTAKSCLPKVLQTTMES